MGVLHSVEGITSTFYVEMESVFMIKVRVYLDWLRALPRTFVAAGYSLAVILCVLTLGVPLTSAELTHKEATVISTTPSQPIPAKNDAPTAQPVITPQSSTVTPAPAPTPQRTTTPAPVATPTPAYDKVSIPSIGLTSQIVTVGLVAGNTIDVHKSLVGWWNGSARPGTNGATFLDGHNPGVLKNLQNISVGDRITVSLADGNSYTYTVVHREVVPLVGIDMGKALRPYNNAAQGLNMMTCMGAYNPATGTTDQRLVVYATR